MIIGDPVPTLIATREHLRLSKGHSHQKAPIEAPQDVKQYSVVQPTVNDQSDSTVNILACDFKVRSQENAT
jgi:hypothetical protein